MRFIMAVGATALVMTQVGTALAQDRDQSREQNRIQNQDQNRDERRGESSQVRRSIED